MTDLFRQLNWDAEGIAGEWRQCASSAATERQQVEKRLAELDNIERAARDLPDRLRVLKDTYERRDQPLCPRCALEGQPNSVMHAGIADDPEHFESFVCRVCGHHATVSLRD